MKIAYISPVYFSDVDLSLLPSLMTQTDVDYYIPLSNAVHKGAAIAVDKVLPINNIIKAENYKELNKLSDILPTKNCFVINNCCKRLRSIKSFWLSFKLYNYFRKQKYDVIHITEFPKLHEIFIYLLRNKIILTVHDPFPHSSVKSKSIAIERWIALKLLKRFVLLNQSQKEDFITVNKLNSKNVYLSRLSCYDYLHIYDYNDVDSFNENDYILFFGQITSHKGVDDLLSAMTEVHKMLPNLHLVVAGKWKWNYNYEIYESLEYIHIINRFILDNELASLIRYSKFVVAPYHDATQSGVIMSAFAYNKPCIVTKVGGLPEMVVDRKFGRIIDPKDRDTLAKVIVELYQNPLDLTEYSKNIEKYYHSGYMAWPTITKELCHIYHVSSD